MTKTFHQAIKRGSAKESQDALNQNRIFRQVMKEEASRGSIFVVIQVAPTHCARRDESDGHTLYESNLALKWKAMTTLEASHVEEVGIHTPDVEASIV